MQSRDMSMVIQTDIKWITMLHMQFDTDRRPV